MKHTLAIFTVAIGTALLSHGQTTQIVDGSYAGGMLTVQSGAVRQPRTELGIAQQPNEKMDWLLEARFGMFIHWGLYSGVGTGEWVMENKGIAIDEYRKLAYPASGEQYFSAEGFDANEWAQLAKDAGMRYMSLTTMHHDGYALFDSRALGAFTSQQTHNRDFVREYVEACRSHDLRVGLYKTLINWRYPGYYDVDGTDCKQNKFGYTTAAWHKENARLMKEQLYSDTKQLMSEYGKIDILFWDGGWLGQRGSDADGAYFWESGKYLDPNNAWQVNPYFQDLDPQTSKPLGLMGIVRKYQPDILVNPRSGWVGDFKSEEGGAAITGPVRKEDIWEKCLTMASGWGYTPSHSDPAKVLSPKAVKRMLADCIIRNMSLLLNVAPDRHGRISNAEQTVLREVGEWIKTVSPAIYGTKGGPWDPKDGEYGYAYKDNTLYVFLLDGFAGNALRLPTLPKGYKVQNARYLHDNTPVKVRNNQLAVSRQGDITVIAVTLNRPLQ